MADRQAELQRAARASAREVRQARREFQCSLQADRRSRVQEAGSTIEVLMDSDHIQKAWDRISRWYRKAMERKRPHLGRYWTR